MDAKGFAADLRAALTKSEPCAAALSIDGRRDSAALGIRYGEGPQNFLPLVGVAKPSKSFNVMWLFIWNDGDWAPTLQRGTPAVLAKVMLEMPPEIWLKYAREAHESDRPDGG